MKKTTGYSINFAENTITLTKAFAQRAKNPATSEFRELAKLHKNFPELTITMRTAVITADKETHGGLTISRMEFLIKNYLGDVIALAEFKEAQKFYKRSLKNQAMRLILMSPKFLIVTLSCRSKVL
jgi:hypothetical protein